MASAAATVAVALAIGMGVHVIRAFLAMVIWNIAVERSAAVLGLIALAIWAVGLAGWLSAPRTDPVRSVRRLAILFALVYVTSHLIADPIITPALAVLSIVAWLWFVPGLLEALARVGSLDALAPGILVGFAAQVALQTALHGLDMSMLRGVLPGLGAGLLSAALLASTYAIRPSASAQRGVSQPLPGWGMIALGPYLVLQLTLLANLGRVQMLSGWNIALASALVLLGFAAGAAVQPLDRSRAVRITTLGTALVLLQPNWLRAGGVWLLAATQLLLAIALAAALAPAHSSRLRRPHLPGAAGMLLAFGLTFLFYSRYEWVALWSIMAALVAIPAVLWGQPAIASRIRRHTLAIIIIGVIGIAGGRIAQPSSPAQTVPPAQLRVMTYNIRMGFDGLGVPGPLPTARVIDASNADVVALQEVGRGWTVNGGVDLAAWLRWRFPQYHFIYGAMNGDLWGNVILSRYEIRDSGSVRFPVRESRFQRGLTWALVSSAQGDLLILNAHLAHDSAADRLEQAEDILEFWRNRERTILLGDFNDGPSSPPVQRLRAAGFIDALAAHGLGAAFTFPSVGPSERLDYIFVSEDLRSLSGAIRQTTASDHLPVLAEIRLR